jgi:YD repeat-containing protein
VTLFLLLLISASVAQAFDQQSYRTRDGRSSITLNSSDELEYRVSDGAILLCKYTSQKEALRVILTTLGTQQVLYFRRVPQGLISSDGTLYLSPSALAEAQRQEGIAKRAQENARAQEQQRRSEEQRLANIAAQRQAEEQRLADDRARKEAPEKLRALLAPRPTLNGTYQTGYGPKKMWLKVTSFDSGTGSVTADVDDVDVKQGSPNHAVGNVSGDTLTLTSDSKPSMRYRLRYDGLGRKLTGTWDTGEKTRGGGAEFALP